MIKITYEIHCDACRAHISTQKIDAGRTPDGALVYPQPSLDRVVAASSLILCDTCWEPMRTALYKRIRELQERST